MFLKDFLHPFPVTIVRDEARKRPGPISSANAKCLPDPIVASTYDVVRFRNADQQMSKQAGGRLDHLV